MKDETRSCNACAHTGGILCRCPPCVDLQITGLRAQVSAYQDQARDTLTALGVLETMLTTAGLSIGAKTARVLADRTRSLLAAST